MNDLAFRFRSINLVATGSGALWWPEIGLLCVSDLHLGKSGRFARRGGSLLPPYDGRETLTRLDADIRRLGPKVVICLGDSFDDDDAARSIDEDDALWIARLQAGRRWVWISGNHDPGRAGPGGSSLDEFETGDLVFRHMARPDRAGEVSGHYHPKVTLRGRAGRITRPCFLYDGMRLVMPAYGAYTGGLSSTSEPLRGLMAPDARAILTGGTPAEIPLSAA